MAGGYGAKSFVGWAEEPTWGTGVAATKFAELVSEGVEVIRDRVPRETVRNLHVREDAFYDEKFGGAGPFVIEANYVGMLRLIEHLFGDASGVTTNPDPGVRWRHTFGLTDTLKAGKGLSVHVNTDVDSGGTPQRRYVGVKLNKAKFTFDPKKNVQIEFGAVAKDYSSIAAVSPTFPGSTLYIGGNQTIIEIDDVARQCDLVTFEVDNAMDVDKRVLGSKQIAEPVRGDERPVISGEITVDAEAADLSKFDAGTLFKFEAIATGAALGGSGNYQFTLVALKCAVTGDPYHITTPGKVKSVIPFRAREPNSGALLQCIVDNNESAIA